MPTTIEQKKPKLVDGMGRHIINLRISVTDRCNFRCTYCMPADNVEFMDRDKLLTFEEITRIANIVSSLGIHRLRLTGGEPLMRKDLHVLIGMLSKVEGIDDIAMTTNAFFLKDQARRLREAGLQRLNISLDALDPEKFKHVNRRDCLQQVLDGLAEASKVGYKAIKINAVAMRNFSESEIMRLIELGRSDGFEIRFIEFMPLDADGQWDNDQVLSGQTIRRVLEDQIGPLVPLASEDPSQPATDYAFADGVGTIGFISPVTEPFCHRCNRLRLTAEGQLRNCLFSTEEWDARQVMRGGGTDEELAELVRASIGAKKAGHGINSDEFVKPQRAMYQIGG
ncbi:MAG: GTP 3',8-cyclase MoaA [Nitrospinae bacterium]|nr:GTP 3',8-cyclase MoaA [Nitrospinota bacterium]